MMMKIKKATNNKLLTSGLDYEVGQKNVYKMRYFIAQLPTGLLGAMQFDTDRILIYKKVDGKKQVIALNATDYDITFEDFEEEEK